MNKIQKAFRSVVADRMSDLDDDHMLDHVTMKQIADIALLAEGFHCHAMTDALGKATSTKGVYDRTIAFIDKRIKSL